MKDYATESGSHGKQHTSGQWIGKISSTRSKPPGLNHWSDSHHSSYSLGSLVSLPLL